jgi:hypothetical protein
MNSRGDEFEGAAQTAAFFKTVLLFGVPRWRPPRRSPGLEPWGIASLLFFDLAEFKSPECRLRQHYLQAIRDIHCYFVAIFCYCQKLRNYS